jgi:hypothetical protein
VSIAGRDVLFGIDSHDQIHLFMPVRGKITEDVQSVGVRLVSNQLEEGVHRWSFADLVCTKSHLHPTFHMLAEEILQSLSKDELHPDRVAIVTLNRWRDLLSRPATPPLGLSELGGLFAELTFLKDILGRRSDAILGWTGPLKQRHDFSFKSASVEVKASLSSQKTVVRINGLEQLTPSDGRALYLLHYRLEAAEDGATVAALVGDIIGAGADAAAIRVLLSKLSYYPEHEEQYEQFRFRITANSAYHVGDDFPRLSPQSFVGSVPPPAVVGVTYLLDLAQTAKWMVSRNAWADVLTAISMG